jgi:isopentenyldiphosphate isomerase
MIPWPKPKNNLVCSDCIRKQYEKLHSIVQKVASALDLRPDCEKVSEFTSRISALLTDLENYRQWHDSILKTMDMAPDRYEDPILTSAEKRVIDEITGRKKVKKSESMQIDGFDASLQVAYIEDDPDDLPF